MANNIHNIGIIAHIDAGKTTTSERLLYITGKSHRLGTVDQGTTVMDWMEQEQNRGITITSAATTIEWNSHTINFIDTPGHVDFTIEVERSLRILDGAVGIFCAVGGVEPQSETIWHQSERYHVPKIAYINKMDRIGADFPAVLEDIQNKLRAIPIPLYIPIGVEKDFEGIIDILHRQEIHWVPDSEGTQFETTPIRASLREMVDTYYANSIEILTSLSIPQADSIAELYLEGKEIPVDLIVEAIKIGMREDRLLPIFCGASLKDIGIQPLLDGIITYLPTPDEVPLPTLYEKHDIQQTTPTQWDNDNRLMAVVFKSEIHKDFGLVHYVRIYRGTMKQASVLIDLNTGKKERVTRILYIHAHKYEQTDSISAGEIGAIIGPYHARTGHTLSDMPKPALLLEPFVKPNPVISTSIEVHNISERDKLFNVLEKIVIEDPSFHYKEDENTGQILISGMGELHLNVIATKIQNDYKLPVRQGKPQVHYREGIQHSYTHSYNLQEHHSHISNDKDCNVILTLQVEPAAQGEGILYQEEVTESFTQDNAPPPFSSWVLPTMEQSFLESTTHGIALGYPIVDIKITLKTLELVGDFKTSQNDMLLKFSCAQALLEACKQADPITLEPVMKVQISVPVESIGDVMGTITTRKGTIHEIENHEAIDIIHAEAPLREMFGYSTALRNASQGRAVFSMEFAFFAPVSVSDK